MPDWIHGAVEQVYILAPEDIATTALLKNAIRKSHDFDAERISWSEFSKFLDDHDIRHKMEAALRKFLNNQDTQGLNRALNDDDITQIAEALLSGGPQTFPVSRSINSKSYDTAIVTTNFFATDKKIQAKLTSNLPLSTLDKADIPGIDADYEAIALAHEATHIVHIDLPPLQADSVADAGSCQIYEEERKLGNVQSSKVPAFFMGMRALGIVMHGFTDTHATSLPVNLSKSKSEARYSPNEFIQARKNLLDALALELGRQKSEWSSTDTIYQNVLNYSEPYSGFDKIILKPGEDQVLRDLRTAFFSDEKTDFSSLYKRLSNKTFKALEEAIDASDRDFGYGLITSEPKLTYATLSKMVGKGDFDDNDLEKRYAQDFLKAASQYAPEYFGVTDAHELALTPSAAP